MALTMSMRQPFANLDMDSPRLRNLGNSKLNIKNQQNVLATPSKSRQLQGPDAENTDPTATLKLSAKRKRVSDEELIKEAPKPTKTTRTILTPRTAFSPLNHLPCPSTPKSAPALASTHKPAGRSPQIKSSKPFARRSTIAKNRSELMNTGKKGVRRPFSLAVALSNGKYKSPSPQSQLQPRKPSSWFFDIHEDSKEEEMTNLMQHSTCVLDISDNEDSKRDCEGRGKENIPPCELDVTPFLSAARDSRKHSGEKDERAPLGELNAVEYYGAGCNAFSYVVVQDDESGNVSEVKKTLRTSSSLVNVSITADLDVSTPLKPADETVPDASEAEFAIWESRSAAGDD